MIGKSGGFAAALEAATTAIGIALHVATLLTSTTISSTRAGRWNPPKNRMDGSEKGSN
jgi:hypothetical protein